jgi:hypothetical protein
MSGQWNFGSNGRQRACQARLRRLEDYRDYWFQWLHVPVPSGRLGQPFGVIASVVENIRIFVAQQVQPAAGRQEREARFRQLQSTLTYQCCLETRP